MQKIPLITTGVDPVLKQRFNQMATVLNAMMSGSSGDGKLLQSATRNGNVATISSDQMNTRVPNLGQSFPVRRARTAAAAGEATTIVCNLYDFDGAEQTTGDESGITVYCTVTNSANLDAAVPRLANDLDVVVAYLPYSPTEYRWYMVGYPFAASEDCEE